MTFVTWPDLELEAILDTDFRCAFRSIFEHGAELLGVEAV